MSIIDRAYELSRRSGNMGGSLRDYFRGLAINDKLASQGIKSDYDYAIAGGSQGLATNGRGHYTDIGKTPNHPTFSTESAYNDQQHQGGVWDRVNGIDRFTPSQQMLQDAARMEALKNYWDKAEKGNILNMKGLQR